MRLWWLCLACAPTWAWQTFTPSAFTIQRIVGQLGFATEVEWQYYADGEKRNRNPLDPNQPSRTVEASGISVRLFQGELFGGEKVLLKEYLSCARDIGENELSMYGLLCDGGKEYPPQLGSLLGHMQSDSSFDSDAFRDNWGRSIPSTPPPASGNLWLVFRWEGLSTVGSFPRVAQPKPWLDLTGGRQMRDARAKYLTVLTGRCLQVPTPPQYNPLGRCLQAARRAARRTPLCHHHYHHHHHQNSPFTITIRCWRTCTARGWCTARSVPRPSSCPPTSRTRQSGSPCAWSTSALQPPPRRCRRRRWRTRCAGARAVLSRCCRCWPSMTSTASATSS